MNHENAVKVWDPILRIFHWALVVFFIASYASGEEESMLHIWSGYAIAGLVIFRLIWGLFGPKHARFSDFIYSPKEIVAYACGLLTGKAKRYLGHNPLGGLMVVALLVSLSMSAVTGMMLYGVEEGKGPLAGVMQAEAQITVPQLISTAQADDDEHESRSGGDGESEMLEEAHEFFANFTVFLIVFHLIGVLFESIFHRESLIRAMFSGYKPAEPK
jgi:cytochrome b